MVVIVGVIGAVYLAQASTTAAIGRRLQTMESQRQAIEQQNAQLRAEIAALRSVPRLISEAERLGFRDAQPDEVSYLRLEGVPPPAEVESTEDVIEPDILEEVVSTYDETLESWLSVRLTNFREGAGLLIDNTFSPEDN